jgi:chromosome segregation ATPase
MPSSITKRTWLLGAATVICGVAATSRPIAFQAAPAAVPADAVAEIRALRAELRNATALLVHAQIAAGQLQITERRFGLLQTELVEIRRQLEIETVRKEKPSAALKSAEESVAAGLPRAGYAVTHLRGELAPIEQREQSLRAQESELLTQLKNEEQRWSALNARLDGLEGAASKTEPVR